MTNKHYWYPFEKSPKMKDQDHFDLHNEWIMRDKSGLRVEKELLFCKKNPLYFFANWCWIVNKQGEGQLFRLNDVQEKYHKERTDADIILKDRKLGFSTYSIMEAFYIANFSKNKNCAIVTHELVASQEMLEKVHYVHNRLPDWLRLKTQFKNKNAIYFEDTTSKISVYTAGSKDQGRSKDIDFLLFSEAAHYPDLRGMMIGIGQARRPKSIVRIETTANGFNEFKDYWDGAEEKKNEYKTHFFGVFDSKQNMIPITKYELDNWGRLIPPDFRNLADKYKHITKQHIKYYYEKAKQLNMNKNMLKQEHPRTAEEAFIFSGDCYFEIDEIKSRKEKCKEYGIQEKRNNGDVHIFVYPKKGHEYILGADPADGGGSDSAFQVIDCKTGEVVCDCASKLKIDRFSDLCFEYLTYYNMAVFGCERNNHGHAVLERIATTYDYQHIYKHREFDRTINAAVRRRGFPTNATTKPLACSLLLGGFNDKSLIIYSLRTLNQLSTFSNDLKAQRKYKDDLVMSLTVAVYVNKYGQKFIRKSL